MSKRAKSGKKSRLEGLLRAAETMMSWSKAVAKAELEDALERHDAVVRFESLVLSAKTGKLVSVEDAEADPCKACGEGRILAARPEDAGLGRDGRPLVMTRYIICLACCSASRVRGRSTSPDGKVRCW